MCKYPCNFVDWENWLPDTIWRVDMSTDHYMKPGNNFVKISNCFVVKLDTSMTLVPVRNLGYGNMTILTDAGYKLHKTDVRYLCTTNEMHKSSFRRHWRDFRVLGDCHTHSSQTIVCCDLSLVACFKSIYICYISLYW